MLSPTVRILNFDNSLLKQKNLLQKFHPTIVDLKEWGPEARIWLPEKAAAAIRSHLNPQLKNSITFLGSGDFHQVTSLLLEQFDGPLTVIVFDHHPDWDILPPRLHCGSWVTEALRRKNIKKMILLGVSSSDLSTFSIQSGNLASLKASRVEIYPYVHPPTKVFLREVPPNPSVRIEKRILSRKIEWEELQKKNLREFFLALVRRLETRQVYVSIDKDCLKERFALTNWEEGCFALDELLLLLSLILEHLEVVGLDIVGDYSEARVKGLVKRALARWDRPVNFTAKGQSEEWISNVNEETNLKLVETLRRTLLASPVEPKQSPG